MYYESAYDTPEEFLASLEVPDYPEQWRAKVADNQVYSIDEMFEARNRKWDEAPCPFDLFRDIGALKEGCRGAGCPCGAKPPAPAPSPHEQTPTHPQSHQ